MKTKLEMAHEYLIKIIEVAPDESTKSELVSVAWAYADLMWSENINREKIAHQDLSQEVWQPDWSQAPVWAKWWAVDKDRIAHYFENKPTKYITMWFPYYSSNTERANGCEYTGDWNDSLRERPQ